MTKRRVAKARRHIIGPEAQRLWRERAEPLAVQDGEVAIIYDQALADALGLPHLLWITAPGLIEALDDRQANEGDTGQ